PITTCSIGFEATRRSHRSISKTYSIQSAMSADRPVRSTSSSRTRSNRSASVTAIALRGIQTRWSAFENVSSDPGNLVLAGLSQSLELLAAAALARFLIIGFATHLLAKSASLAQLAEAAHRFLDGLTRSNP